LAPEISTRRIDVAWETAQKFAEARQPSWPAAFTCSDRLPRVRQKLLRATQ
jgi:hypothetical protein